MVAVIVAQPVPNLSPQTEAARKMLNMLGMILMVAGGFSLVSFWAAYYLGFVLSVGSIITGYTQYVHTKDANAMVNCHTVVGARTAFNTIQQMNYVGCILGFIATILSAYACYVWSVFASLFMAYVIFSIVGLLAALTIACTAGLSAQKCGDIHREVIVLIPAPAGGPAAAGGAYVQMPQQAAYGQPQQAAYGQPQQAYGNPQQNAYGAPQGGYDPNKQAAPSPGYAA